MINNNEQLETPSTTFITQKSKACIVSALVPAYNEESRISRVLEVLVKIKYLNEIVVIDDGSQDQTSLVAEKFNVRVIRLEKNIGKGGALQAGFDNVVADIFVLFDADLINLNTGHVDSLVEPLVKNYRLAMALGKFKCGDPIVDFGREIFDTCGQRAITKDFIEYLPDLTYTRFGVEVIMNKVCKNNCLSVKKIALADLRHHLKEKKRGYLPGLVSRLLMWKDIVKHCYSPINY